MAFRRRQTRPSALPAATLLVATSLLFTPATLYLSNAPEMRASLPALLAYSMPAAAALIGALVVLAALLPERLRRHYVALLFGIGVALWTEGNLLVWDHGVFDGRPIDWSRHVWANAVDVAAWTAILSACWFLVSRVGEVSRIGSLALLAAQSLALVVRLAQHGWNPAPCDSILRPESLVYSARGAVLHVILDAFQSDVFGEIVEEDGLADDLEGFVWFRNNLGGFPSTLTSIPYLLAGRMYANQRSLADFLSDALDGPAFYNRLREIGYDVHLTPSWPVERIGKVSTCYRIPEPYGAPARVALSDALTLFDLMLFRSLPNPLKPYVHRDGQWLTLARLRGGERPGKLFAHLAFVRDYTARIEVRDGPPSYHLLHLMMPHYPLVSDRECRYVPAATQPAGAYDAYEEQARCALRTFRDLLDALRERGIYDSTLVVLQSDHGVGRRVRMRGVAADGETPDGISPRLLADQTAGLALALLAVKLPHEHRALRISDAPTTAADVGPTVLSAAGVAVTEPSAFALGPGDARVRQYFEYQWRRGLWGGRTLGPMQEYRVEGDVHDVASWRRGRVILPLDGVDLSPEIDFGTLRGAQQMGHGWGTDEILEDGTTVGWALGRSASVVLPSPQSARARLSANLAAYPGAPDGQRIELRLDGTAIGAWEIPREEIRLARRDLVFPVRSPGAESVLELVFQSHMPLDASHAEQRPLAALFDWLRIEAVP